MIWKELSARLKALIRRTQVKTLNQKLQVADLVLDQNTQKVFRNESRARAYSNLPKNFIDSDDRIMKLSIKEIEKFIWSDSPPDGDALRSHIYALRKSIDKPFASPLIHTVPSVGWRLQAVDEDRIASK